MSVSIEAYKKLRPQDYDEFIQIAGMDHAGALNALCSMVRVAPKSILELGVGTGLLTQRLLARYPHATVTGIDGSSEMLGLGEKKLAPDLHRFFPKVTSFENCDWDALEGRPFDLIVTSFALHHMDHAAYPAFFRKMLSLLRPGGQLLVADLVSAASPELQRHYIGVWVDYRLRQTKEKLGIAWTKDALMAEHLKNMREEGDNPAPIPSLVRWMSEAGFSEAEVHWQLYCAAVYGGLKPAI
jgi:tRNA (cmo5U34)-methyltransferase